MPAVPPTEYPSLPPRPVDGHKGTFGTVCVLGGQAKAPRVMIGGPAFAALGALRAGCGLAVLAVPRPLMASALIIAPPATGLALPVDRDRQLIPSAAAELMDNHIDDFSVLAIGPGLGADEPQQQIVARLIARDETPLVVDADALNCLAAMPEFQKDFRAPAILTPHPGEYGRLARALGMGITPGAESDRVQATTQLAQRLGCVVVLKGHRTVISDGINTTVNETGNVALATAGTGDVLTGVIAGLVAQHYRAPLAAAAARLATPAKPHAGLSLFDCARLGVHIHGRAADLWAERHGGTGMTAMDLLTLVPAAVDSRQ
jgi:ADP-dependent NAD(P)H-hydrate dehydratase